MSLIAKQEEEIVSEYLNWVKRHRAPSTIKRTRTEMVVLKKIADIADRSIFELSPQEIEDYLLENHRNPYTFNGYRSGLKSFYKYCITKGLIGQNPIIFPRVKMPKNLPKPLTPTQQEILLKRLKNVKWRFACELVMNTGIRRAELIKLRISDIDEAEMVLRVRSRYQGGGGKGDKERLIPITPSLLNTYHNYLKEYRIMKKANSWVFPGIKGGHTNEESLRHYLSKMKKKLGFKVNPHMLRHTYATNHVNAGTDIRVLQVLLGHEKIMTTEQYTKVNLVAMRKAQEKGTILGEKDRLIAELTKKDREIGNLRKTVRDMKEKLGNFLQIIDRMDDQES